MFHAVSESPRPFTGHGNFEFIEFVLSFDEDWEPPASPSMALNFSEDWEPPASPTFNLSFTEDWES